MKIEDYNKYYIQGSDHYLIPNSIIKEVREYIDDLEEVKKVYDIKYRENKVLKEQVLLYKTVLHKIEQYCNTEKSCLLIGGGEVCEDVLKIIEEIKNII